jgi:hypothetical protein
MNKPPVIEIFYFDAGGGHRNAMNALKDVLAERYPAWRVKTVDLQELLEPIDLIHKITQKILSPRLRHILKTIVPHLPIRPICSQDIYNAALKRGITRGARTLLALLQIFIEGHAAKIDLLMRSHWQNPQNEKPDLVVSVIPNFNKLIFRALKRVFPYVPYVTIMTDMVDIPPHFWMEDQDQFLVCGTIKAFEQAKKTRFYNPEKLFAVSGMILKSSFYAPSEKASPTHRDIGLLSDLPTALIMFGGNGSSISEIIVDQLEKAELGVQTIVICGHNRKLYDSLQGRKNCHAVGFVSNVPDYMRLADIFIGKPGPGSISEALHMGCPVIIECNAATLPQERPNVAWILENSVGIAVKSFKRGIVPSVRSMIDDLESFQRNIKNNIPENRAIYESADILNQILKTASQRSSGFPESAI